MEGSFKKKWKEFQRGTPGRRFQERYERNKHDRKSKPWYTKFLHTALAVLVLAVGVFLMFFPGPGIPFLLVGAGLLADQALFAARFLDWAEVRLRRIFLWLKSWWQHASILSRSSAVLVLGSAASGGGYLLYSWLIVRG